MRHYLGPHGASRFSSSHLHIVLHSFLASLSPIVLYMEGSLWSRVWLLLQRFNWVIHCFFFFPLILPSLLLIISLVLACLRADDMVYRDTTRRGNSIDRARGRVFGKHLLLGSGIIAGLFCSGGLAVGVVSGWYLGFLCFVCL